MFPRRPAVDCHSGLTGGTDCGGLQERTAQGTTRDALPHHLCQRPATCADQREGSKKIRAQRLREAAEPLEIS